MHYQWDFAFLLRYAPLFWRGVLVTLGYTAATIFLGLIIGLVVGLGRLSRSRLLNIPLIAFIEAVPLHAAAGADRLVLLRAAGAAGHPDPGDGGGGDDAVLLHRRVLRGDLPRRDHFHRAGAVGRGAGAGAAALAR